MYDCKPLYNVAGLSSTILAIQFNGKVGYIVKDDSTKVQLCAGYPMLTDLVPSAPSTSAPLTTRSTTTTATPETPALTTDLPTTTTAESSTRISTPDVPTTQTTHPLTTTLNPSTTISSTKNPPTTTTVTTTLRSTQLPTIHCPSGWKLNGTSCYLVKVGSHDGRTWADAKHYCSQHNSHLVFIESATEQEFINSQIHTSHPDSHDKAVWIGAEDKTTENRWYWLDQEPISIYSFSNWNPGEPDDKSGQDCAANYRYYNSGTWTDRHCTDHFGFVCERSLDLDCEPGWVRAGDTCYLFHTRANDTLDWNHANAQCVSHGSHLIFINNQAEQSNLRAYLQHHRPQTLHGDNPGIWIGAKDSKHEGSWLWTDTVNHINQQGLHFTSWVAGESNHDNAVADCAAMDGTHDYHWNDYPCSTHMHYICEKLPTVPVATS